MDSPDTLADIAIFAAVVREGSFTRAADKLELSTSQVSKCVSRLERLLGARLLQRTTRRLRLTEAGSALYENSSSALAAIEEAKLAVSKLQGTPRGKLKVSTSTAFGTMQLPRVVGDLDAQYPELEVELLLEDRHVDLVREGIDIAIRITGETPDSGHVYRRLAPNRQVICASPAYIERRGLPRTPADLANHNCIAHSARATPRVWHLTGSDGGQVSVQINGRPTINSALAVRQAALEGLGIVELNSYIVGEDIIAGRLVRRPELPQLADRRQLPIDIIVIQRLRGGSDISSVESIIPVAVSLATAGHVNDLFEFITDIEHIQELTVIREWSLTRGVGTGQYSLQAEVIFFFKDES
jgi:DNA-binding transcriptional LysR family regulator